VSFGVFTVLKILFWDVILYSLMGSYVLEDPGISIIKVKDCSLKMEATALCEILVATYGKD
jgi:hypothetical protein